MAARSDRDGGWTPVLIVDRSPGLSPAQLEELRASDIELEGHAGDDLQSAIAADDLCCEMISAVGLCSIPRDVHTGEEVAKHPGYHAHEFIGVNDPGSCVKSR